MQPLARSTFASAPLVVTDLLLPARAPFHFEHTLSFLRSFPATRGEQVVGPTSVSKALCLEGRVGLLEVRGAGGGVRVTVSTQRAPDARWIARLSARVRTWLSLEDDLGTFAALAAQDEAFAPIAERWRGHHHVKFPSPFEITVWAVLGQRDQRRGRRAKDALVAALGPRIAAGGTEHRAFPEPQALLEPSRLRALLGDATSADAIAVIARAFRDLDVERTLLRAPLPDAEAYLRSLPRIGPWSAAFVLFRGLGRMERLGDRSGPILEAARKVYGALSERRIREIAEGFGPFCGYWALYLRRS